MGAAAATVVFRHRGVCSKRLSLQSRKLPFNLLLNNGLTLPLRTFTVDFLILVYSNLGILII